MLNLALAAKHFEAEEFAAAEKVCRGLLEGSPDDLDARHLLALAIQRQGRTNEAIPILKELHNAHPRVGDFAFNLAVALQEIDDLTGASDAYRKALKSNPSDADALYNLAVVLRTLGQLKQAVLACRKAINIRPTFSNAHNNLGNLYRDLGKKNDAIECFKTALRHNPQNLQAHTNLAKTAHQADKKDLASQHFSYAATLATTAENKRFLASNLIETGRVQDAISLLAPGLVDAPETDPRWTQLLGCLLTAAPKEVSETMSVVLLKLIELPTTAPFDIAPSISDYLTRHPRVASLLRDTSALTDPQTASDAARALSRLPLLLATMRLTPIPNPELETLFVCLRRGLATAATASCFDPEGLPFAVSLALQAFTNEYIYQLEENELSLTQKLAQDFTKPEAVCMVACYEPLNTFEERGAELSVYRDGQLSDLIQQQIDEPAHEHMYAEDIRQPKPIEDQVSGAVRSQYEAHPYPRWVKAPRPREETSLPAMLEATPYNYAIKSADITSPMKVLIAGCGTGQHPLMVASRFPNADITAIDLSLASLAYAKRKAFEVGVTNIQFAQLDLLDVDALCETYDLVESIGVLHHMADPLLGWRRLSGVLRPAGFMKIGLYSERARGHITRVAQVLQEQGFTTSNDDIRKARTFIRSKSEAGEPDMKAVMQASDFYSLSEVRDLLFHVKESRMSLPDIQTMLADLKLHFLGFELQDPKVWGNFRKLNPGPRSLTSLSAWDKFERQHPETFRAMYQFWCQKK